MAIIISREGKNAKKIEKSTIEAEDYLQKYIYDNPESLPLYDIKEDIRLLIVSREFPTTSGPIDALGIDRDGEIYVIETKLYKNPDKRLVLAQVLDYGAALWRGYSNFNDFLTVMNEQASRQLDMSFSEKAQDFFGIADDETATLRENMKNNLNSGSFKFVVLMDRLSDRLKDLIIYMNQNSRFDIFGVELEYYKFNEYEIMIPRLFGSEVKVKPGISTTSERRKKWDEESFFRNAAERLKQEEVQSVRDLYDFSKQNASQISWGTGAVRGSFNPKFDKISVRSLYTVYSDGTLQLNFGWLHDNETTKRYRDEFRKCLQGLLIPSDHQEDWASVPIDQWAPKLKNFENAVEDLLQG